MLKYILMVHSMSLAEYMVLFFMTKKTLQQSDYICISNVCTFRNCAIYNVEVYFNNEPKILVPEALSLKSAHWPGSNFSNLVSEKYSILKVFSHHNQLTQDAI